MIDKFLDNYYSKKLNRYIRNILLYYTPSYKIEKNKNIVSIYIKRKEYQDKYYKKILDYDIDRAFDMLLNFKSLENDIHNFCKTYFIEGEN